MQKFYLLLILLMYASLLTAQNAGQLSGRILDEQSQLPIQGVTVLLEGTVLGIATDEGGYFTLGMCLPGPII